jgi:hypothetical protein
MSDEKIKTVNSDKYAWMVDGPKTPDSVGLQPTQGEHVVENEGITQGFFDNANKFVMDHLVDLNNVGTASYVKPKIAQLSRSRTDMFANGVSDEEDLPVGPGNTYLTHLFNHHKIKDKMAAKKAEHEPKSNIYTDQQEALRTAMSIVGCYSERNPGGMPIEINDAQKIWFGDKEVSKQEQSVFRSTLETGDSKLDAKKVRKFVNHDGSLTWEVLNDDKTVMNRFTMGEYAGTKIFSQGGYKNFAEMLKEAKGKLGKDTGGEFDAIRSAYSGV